MANLIQMAYEVCTAIEECGASEKLTAANLKAYELYKAVKEIRALIADDAYAITFQSMGQYRRAILKAIDGAALLAAQPAEDARADRQHCTRCEYIGRCDCEPKSADTRQGVALSGQAPLAKTQVNAMQRLGRIFVSSSIRAEASLSFSCAKRAADPGNEFSACRQWCGSSRNCPSDGSPELPSFDFKLFYRYVDILSDMSEEERDSAGSGVYPLSPELNTAVHAVNQTETRVRRRAILSRASSSRAEVEIPWDRFPAWLIDHCEGDTITEEGLQRALADMLAAAEAPNGEES